VLAPEPYLSACLEVLHRAAIYARLLGWNGDKVGLSVEEATYLGHLMDAVHEIPRLLQRWETCDEDLLRGMLEDLETKFTPRDDLRAGLRHVYRDTIAARHGGLTVVATLTLAERAAFVAFDALAAQVMARHGAAVERAIRIPGEPEREVHVVRFPSSTAWDAYRADPELAGLRELRARGISATEILVGDEHA
jgi:hypothetical protein